MLTDNIINNGELMYIKFLDYVIDFNIVNYFYYLKDKEVGNGIIFNFENGSVLFIECDYRKFCDFSEMVIKKCESYYD